MKRKKLKQKTIVTAYEKPQNTKKAIHYFIKLLDEDRLPVSITVVTNVISTILFALIPWISAIVIDDVIAIMQDTSIIDKWNTIRLTIVLPISSILIIAVVNFILVYYQEFQMARIGETVTLSLRKKLTDKMTKLPLKFYDNHQVGELLSKATSDIDKISEVIITGFNQFIYSALIIIFGIIILFMINLKMAILVFIILLGGSLLTGIISNWNQKLFHNNMMTLSSLSNTTEETLAGNLVVKSFGKEKDFINEMDQQIDAQFKANQRSQFINFSIYPAIRFVNQIAFILAAFLGGQYAIEGLITVGLVQAFLQYVVQISEPISNASYIVNAFQGALVAIERIEAILELDEDVIYPNLQKISEQPQGEVTFSNVSFGYSKNKPLMKNVSFKAKPHQMVAIVGPTGAGKTTLVNLLMHFYEIDHGEILFDGLNINQLSREDLRQYFGMVLQDTWLFKGTVADNIAYGKSEATRDEIIQAAKIAQCDNFIRKLPHGYDTIISSDDGIVSQGEQQLLTIARTVLADPKVMILDEATSSIDTKTERDIQTAIAKVMKNRTSFVIAHRLSTIKNADLILVMNHGDIIEKGTHESLLNNQSFYAKLYQTQFS